MKNIRLTALAAALAAAFAAPGAMAQSNEELLKELRALRA
jgi:formiminotetrahydrofolate cyclodeaminase